MNSHPALFLGLSFALALSANAATPGNAPPLPLTGIRIVNVTNEPQLQNAMGDLQDGDTILLANGTCRLTSSLYINGHNNVTLRGAAGSSNVLLLGLGMNNSNYGNVPFGIWSNSTNTTVAHLSFISAAKSTVKAPRVVVLERSHRGRLGTLIVDINMSSHCVCGRACPLS
jgi:hypothetical protein